MKMQYLNKEDLKIGMEVSMIQLSNIKSTYFLLGNLKRDLNTKQKIGTLEYFGDKNQEMLDTYNRCMQEQGKRPMILHFNEV